MQYTISADRNTLTVSVTDAERANLRELGDNIHSDSVMAEFLEPLSCNSQLSWIPEGATGDLTSAPMLGILGEEGLRDYTVFPPNYGLLETGCDGHNVTAQPVLERWAFMDYQVRSVLEDLRDTGEAKFVASN